MAMDSEITDGDMEQVTDMCLVIYLIIVIQNMHLVLNEMLV